MKYRAVFRGHSVTPQLYIEESTELDWLTSIASTTLKLISQNYHWCGIFRIEDDTLIRELVITDKEPTIDIADVG